MSRDGYVPLATLLTPEEAGMAQGLLETAGIEALLEDQALSAVDPLVRLAIGGTKLLVRAEDANRARALLDETGVLRPASARPTEEVESRRPSGRRRRQNHRQRRPARSTGRGPGCCSCSPCSPPPPMPCSTRRGGIAGRPGGPDDAGRPGRPLPLAHSPGRLAPWPSSLHILVVH